MKKATAYIRATGVPIAQLSGDDLALDAYQNEVVGVIEGSFREGQHLIDDQTGEVTLIPQGNAGVGLDDRRLTRRKQAKDHREAAIEGGCDTPLGRVQTSAVSQDNIMQAVFQADRAKRAGEPWSIVWTMEDNSEIPHDADQMIAMAMAVGDFKRACRDACRPILAAIKASTNPETIDITADYPGQSEE